jgi:SAM-dependent methyltransferase
MTTKPETVRKEVQKHYDAVATQSGGCCGDTLYSPEELAKIPAEAVIGQGSGNPVRHADLQPGEVVVDLGSGAGIDVFLAADAVGPRGKAVGVDMTRGMLDRANRAADRAGVENVEFREGIIESIPLEDGAADVVLSNCVINLSPDKAAVFGEAYRVLKPGGRLVISDIVQERPLNMKGDCDCVSNAMVRAEYLETIRGAGFEDVEVLGDSPAMVKDGSVEASAVTIRAYKKPKEENT